MLPAWSSHVCETLWEALTACCSCVGVSGCDQYTHLESTSNDMLGVHIAVATCSVSCWQPVLSFLALHFADALDLLRDMLSLALLCCSVPTDLCLDVLSGFCLIQFRSCLAMYFESSPQNTCSQPHRCVQSPARDILEHMSRHRLLSSFGLPCVYHVWSCLITFLHVVATCSGLFHYIFLVTFVIHFCFL